MARSNRKIVPECRQVLQQWKYEIAAEFGLPVGYGGTAGVDTEFAGELGAIGHQAVQSGRSGWGHLTSRENGSVGGEITKRLVAHAERDFSL